LNGTDRPERRSRNKGSIEDGLVPYPTLKRVSDKALAAFTLLLASPIALVALALMAVDMLFVRSDRGPFFYRERRISRGREFDLLKLRTLRTDVLAGLGDNDYARLAEADPTNLTRAGRLLKRWYVDELPQLVNILRGDMSLVGPRPWPVVMVKEQIASGLDYRNRVQAGWTGLAQIEKGNPDPVSYTQFDLAYIDACHTFSQARLLRYDFGVLAQTAIVLLRGQGLQY
jgi:lipopolysaccharide/colanic/teichoic acid biosynthesis glycosyltransferase